MEKANLLKVKVYPKDLKAIPDILPFRALIQGEPLELDLTKKEIWRCMHFGDVFDLSSGEEVLIDRPAYNEIVEYVKEETPGDAPSQDEGGNSGNDAPAEDETPSEEIEQALENSEMGVTESLVEEARITR